MATTNPTSPAKDPAASVAKPYGPLDAGALNLPNCITVSRLLLAFVLFGMMSFGHPSFDHPSIWIPSAFVFAFAAATDAVDGYLARRYGMVTTLGRILDPFVDKIIVCGAFIFLLAERGHSGVGPWMVLLVIGREMFVTGLRSILEQQGKDFSASLSGKIKMAAQCLAVVVSLVSLSPNVVSAVPWLLHVRDALLWFAVGVTVLSGVIYIRRAGHLLRTP